MITIKNDKELQLMRESGKILRFCLKELAKEAVAGRNLLELDQMALQLVQRHDAVCAFKGYRGYPANICLSVNDEVVHTIPKNYVLKEGDIVGIDFGVQYRGFITDSAVTVAVGQVPEKTTEFLKVGKDTLFEVIQTVREGIKVGDIGAFIQQKIEAAGYSIVEELTGHGVGRDMHEDPYIPNFGKAGTGPTLEAGMVIAIEPIYTMGKRHVYTDADQWTIKTRDRSLAAQFEHSLIVHDEFAEIIT